MIAYECVPLCLFMGQPASVHACVNLGQIESVYGEESALYLCDQTKQGLQASCMMEMSKAGWREVRQGSDCVLEEVGGG